MNLIDTFASNRTGEHCDMILQKGTEVARNINAQTSFQKYIHFAHEEN